MAGTGEVVEIGKDLLSARYVLGRAFNLHRLRLQFDVDFQPVFHHLQILVAGAEKLLDVAHDLYVFFHSVWSVSPNTAPGSGVSLTSIAREYTRAEQLICD